MSIAPSPIRRDLSETVSPVLPSERKALHLLALGEYSEQRAAHGPDGQIIRLSPI
jgi:hypothetical protein